MYFLIVIKQMCFSPFVFQTTFKGRVFMTPATKAIYKWLLSDYIKVSNISTDQMLYNEKDLEKSMDKIETVNCHQVQQLTIIHVLPFIYWISPPPPPPFPSPLSSYPLLLPLSPYPLRPPPPPPLSPPSSSPSPLSLPLPEFLYMNFPIHICSLFLLITF